MAAVQGVWVEHLAQEDYNRMHFLRVLKKGNNPGLFVYHPEHYNKTLYKRVYDELGDVWDIVFLPRITGLDVFGNEVSGRVVHQQRGRGRTDLDILHGFVVVDVG